MDALTVNPEPVMDSGMFSISLENIFSSGAFNVELLNPGEYIKNHWLSEVTETLIRIPSTTEYHPEGLFSEEIFGLINSPERMTRFGYINLNTTIIAPPIYRFIRSVAPWHEDVMAGRIRAHYDPKTKTLTRSTDGTGDTGFSFYLSIYPDMKFKDSPSPARQERVDVINKYRKQSLYTQYLVEPAGIRDLAVSDTGRLLIDDINKLYIQLLNLAQSMNGSITSPIYDPIRFSIQSKAMEIYSYLDNMMSGKRGFMQHHFGNRRVALGTRNVISAADYASARPDSPQLLKADETQIGLFQVAKGIQPAVLYYLKTLFFDQVFPASQESATVTVVNPKTWEMDYVDVDIDTKERFTSPDGIYSIINRFRAFDYRKRPMSVKDHKGTPYYFYGAYIQSGKLYLFRSIKVLSETIGKPVEELKKLVWGLTWIEALYMATYQAVSTKFVYMTRYPVLGDGSCYPSRVHLVATRPSHAVTLTALYDNAPQVYYPEYPDLNGQFQDGMAISSPHLGPTGGDHDGDTMSANFTLTEDSCEETRAYLNSPKSLLDTNNRLVNGQATDLVVLAFFAFTHTQKDL